MNANGEQPEPAPWTPSTSNHPPGPPTRAEPTWQQRAEGTRTGGGPEPGEGCLYAVVRWPARIIALIIVVPLRLLWELLCLIGRGIKFLLWTWFLWPILKGLKILLWDWFLYPVLSFVGRYILVPIGNAIAWLVTHLLIRPLVFLFRYVLLKPATWLWRYVLRPVGRATLQALRFAWDVSTAVLNFLIVRPLSWLWRAVLVPIGRGIAVVWHHLVVLPVSWAWRNVLTPIGRAIRAVWRFVVVAPLRWVGRTILRPIGRATAEVLRAMGIGGR
ncbi:hypothetical protein OG948_12425 [Embleya sp. NBC_00888]|uniref:hypothetical protein n=1 Tax=Embleya sp. NBC_00888 TaxID=2975960 RepID=UPI0038676681|nr:hypothetical protein OG948_12425 [Embleya sp. NBC_00888]